MKKMMILSKNWYFSVQKALIYYTVNKSHHNSFILLVFSHVANFRYVANLRFLTLHCIETQSLVKKCCLFHNHISCPFTVDTSYIWSQMHPWSSFKYVFHLHFTPYHIIFRLQLLCPFLLSLLLRKSKHAVI